MAILAGARAESLSWRFEGLNAVRNKKELATFKELTGVEQFGAFESSLAHRISTTIATALNKGGPNSDEIAKALDPISIDLLRFPTLYEHSGDDKGAWILAIQLPKERHDLWTSNWNSITKAGDVGGAKLAREGGWTLLGNGDSKTVLEKAKQNSTDLLHIEGDVSFLGKFLPGLKPTKATLRTIAAGNGLRTEGRMQFAEDLPIKLTPWQVPTNTIREPVLAFTAIQGLATYLSPIPLFLRHAPPPNQLFIWNEDSSPFSMYSAAKVDDAPAFVMDLAKGIDPKRFTGRLEMNTNTSRLALMSMPVAIPFIMPAHPSDKNFLYAGVMPFNDFAANAIPPELVGQITSRTNLLIYDWELTGPRLTQIRPVAQVLPMALNKPIPEYRDAGSQWIYSIVPKLQNAITEVAMLNPRELSLIRRSDLGFTAFELWAMTQWVAGPPTDTSAIPAPPPAGPTAK